MIQLSPRGKIQYGFLDTIVLLLVVYACAFLLESLFQLPGNPLPDWLTNAAVTRLSENAAQLLILTAFLAAGLSMTPGHPPHRRLLWLGRGWRALALLILLASPFEASAPLGIATAVFLLAALATHRRAADDESCFRVWRIGMLLICVCLLTAPLAPGRWAEVVWLFRLHVAYGIGSVSLVFWLMRRFSTLESAWIDDGARIVAALVFLGGSLISIAPLSLAPMISLSAAPVIMLSFMILAGHGYRALSHRNADATLAPHWIAQATLFWLVGGAFLGAICAQAGIYEALRGTALADARGWLMTWVHLTTMLAFVNAGAGELRGDNRRVTGYVPLWLIGFGVGLSTIVNACRGVAEIYLREVSSLDAAALRELLLPLTALWMICMLAVGCGILTYALGYRARRPRIKVLPT